MIISNTEVTTKNVCEYAHHLHFNVGVAPKKLPVALYRGIIGHSALEAYYKCMKAGGVIEECLEAALVVIDKEILRLAESDSGDFDRIQLVHNIRNLIIRYSKVYREEQFKVLEVEKKFFTPVDQKLDIHYGLQLDTLVEMTSGEFRGDLIVMDHKFVYNFKTALDIQMDAQLPKYIYALRQNGYFVTKGIFNQVRTREMKAPKDEDLYRRTPLKNKPRETAQIWKEQAKVARDIYWEREGGEFRKEPIRTMSFITCRNCMFQQPCYSALDGSDVTSMLESNYEPSKYGYTDMSVA